MRRITMVAVFMVAVLAFSGVAFAQNELEGFRELKWGDSPTAEMEFLEQMDEMIVVYRNPGESNQLGDARFDMMLHSFYIPLGTSEEKYVFTGLYYNGKENFNILKTICKAKFGEPDDQYGYSEFYWTGLVSTVILTWDGVDEDGYLSIGSSVIFSQYMDEKEQKQVEEAEKDW